MPRKHKEPSSTRNRESHTPKHPLSETGALIRCSRHLESASCIHYRSRHLHRTTEQSSGVNFRINFIIPAIGATMAANSATTLRKSIKPRQKTSPRCTSLPRVHRRRGRCTPLRLWIPPTRINNQKRRPQVGERRRTPPSSDPGGLDIGFPPVLPRLGSIAQSPHGGS
jgi:hypothetical protein